MWSRKPLNTTSTNASILNCFAQWANLACSASALPKNMVVQDWTQRHAPLSMRNSPLRIQGSHLHTSHIRCCLSTTLPTTERKPKRFGFFQRSAQVSGLEPWRCLNQTLGQMCLVSPRLLFNKTMAHGSSTAERCGLQMAASMTKAHQPMLCGSMPRLESMIVGVCRCRPSLSKLVCPVTLWARKSSTKLVCVHRTLQN